MASSIRACVIEIYSTTVLHGWRPGLIQLKFCEHQLLSDETSSFLVSFDAEDARCSLNLDRNRLTASLEARSNVQIPQKCLWLNFWGWQLEHHAMIREIAHRYNVSPRLTHILCPQTNDSAIHVPHVKDQQAVRYHCHNDVEKASLPVTEADRPELEESCQQLTSIADVANDLWHFFTVDFGSRYICIAWNALFFTSESYISVPDGKPNAVRIWSALLLCDDGTIVSVFESPPHLSPRLTQRIRWNQMNVFRHLSRIHPRQAAQNALVQVSIRSDFASSDWTTPEMASLVFYYLSDDWLNICAQVSGGEHSFRHRLEQVRESMIVSAEVELVRTLHQIGKQLTTLKLVYKSYQAVVERLLERHRSLLAQDHIGRRDSSSGLFRAFSDKFTNESAPFEAKALGDAHFRLSTNALARFERLLDRIEICALTEVDECLKEMDALVLMVSHPEELLIMNPRLTTDAELQPSLTQRVSSH